MAEIFVSGILGDEEENQEAEASDVVASIEAFAPAIAVASFRQGHHVACATSIVLGMHTRLPAVQAKHLKVGHTVRVLAESRDGPSGHLVRS